MTHNVNRGSGMANGKLKTRLVLRSAEGSRYVSKRATRAEVRAAIEETVKKLHAKAERLARGASG
jgi:hypothetical protein